MKISCPACAAKYSITDEKVQDRLAKIRCRKCGTTIVIDGKVDPPQITAAAPAAADTAGVGDSDASAERGPLPGDYSVDMGDDDQRSMSVQQIVDAFGRGEINGMTYVWADGMPDWQRLADVAELSSAVGLSSTDGFGATATAPISEPPAARAATRSGTGRGSAADLFGGIESAGSEDDVTTSAPEPSHAPAATGARNESSVLFSLSALTGAATPAPPASTPSFPPKSSPSNDDSGLIDLKALTSTINAPVGGSDGLAMGGMAPLNLGAPAIGMAAPLGGIGHAASANVDIAEPSGRSGGKGALIVGGAILVVGLAAVAVFAMRGGSDEQPAAQAPVKAAEVAPTPAQAPAPIPPTPVKTAEPIASPPPTGTAVPTPAPAETTTKPAAAKPAAAAAHAITAPAKHKAASTTPATSSTSSSSSASSGSSSSSSSSSGESSAPPAEPKKKKCDCKPSDLLCAMRCSAK